MPTGKTKKQPTPEEKEEQEDRKKLREASMKIDEILELITENDSREKSNSKLEEAKTRLGVNIDGEESEKLLGTIFHPHKGKRIPLKLRNSRLLDIIQALESKIKTHSHGEDLQKALTGHAIRKIRLLERALKRISE